ncbi:ATP-dependent DNA helicase PIF1 isoform X2 [Vespula pensylvanica]|uniref:ATP-dependent DNA helicase PIF1 isoform X2 n=1 Tax=Vespula pensylvanica TaxID=30213 RepID=UPI001CBA57A5|nr:ATP-dependent DNA helicase PIF1 isoform X2 [Vespula pensylvanica]
MDSDSYTLSCTVVVEWLDKHGSIIRKITHKSASLRLIRDNFRDMIIEIHAEKANATTKLTLKKISVFNKFMNEGKASIKFQEENCTLFLSNAPSASLINFLKTIFIKMTGQVKKSSDKSLKEKLLSNIPLGGIQEISPVTSTEVNKAKEKAKEISRATVTTPSPSALKKRKRFNEHTSTLPIAKKLYENPTVGDMTEEQSKVLSAVLNGKNVFFTGSAGTGIGIGSGTLERSLQLASRSSSAAVWRKTKHLIVDEISMVDAEFFDKLEVVARHIRKNEKPFGGIQLILCGDFFQLPPVSKRDEKIKFCFQSEAWEKCVHFNFELKIVHRQKDPEFIKILNNIRIGRVTESISNILKATAKQKIESNGILATRLCSHINEADEINNFQLNELKGAIKIYTAQDSDEMMSKALDQQLPVPSKLTLKIGAQVMLVKNINISNGLVNGARGIVTKFVDDLPVIQLRSGNIYHTKIEKWSIRTASGVTVHRKQIPLKLAWAFSIHKSQGLTLDCVEMCLSRVFDAGQSYVALSRAQSLQSLRILDFNSQQVWANTTVLEFYKKFRRNLHEMEMIPIGKKKLKLVSNVI